LLLLLLALLVLGESAEEILAFLDLPVGVSVHDLGKIFHQSEVSSHGVGETSELAELGNESNLVSSLPVLVDKERLIWIRDGLVVPGLVVVLVADLGSLLVKGGLWRHSKVDSLDSVSLLVVLGDNGASHHGSRNSILPISSFLFALVTQL